MIELPRTRSGRAVLVFVFLLACYGYFFPTLNNWGSNSRMNLIYAVVDRGTVRIDDYHQNSGDKAYFDGHYYMEKSIGPSLVGIPFYVAFTGLVRLPPLSALAAGRRGPGALPSVEEVYKKYHLPVPGTPGAGHAPLYHAMALVFVTFFSVAVMSAVLGAVLNLLADRFAAAPADAVVLALAFGLGTPAFAYSNQLYQHQAAAFGAFVGLFVLWRVIEERAPRRWLWMTGFLFGYAAASEYVLAAVVMIPVFWAMLRVRPRRDLLRVAGGAAPWVIATALYNVAAFGTPLPVGYRYSTFAGAFEGGVFGFAAPSWESVYGLTFSPYRGLFLLSPFLLLAPAGFYPMFRGDRRSRDLATVLLLMIAALFTYNLCYWSWSGADAAGPRHLVSLLPLLSLPIILVLNRAKRAWQRAAIALLIGISIIEVWILSLAGQSFPSEMVARPILDYALPLVRAGQLRFNLGTAMGLHGLTAVIPLLILLTTILWCVPRAERVWVKRRLRQSV